MEVVDEQEPPLAQQLVGRRTEQVVFDGVLKRSLLGGLSGAADLAAQAHDTEFKTDFSFDLGAFFHRRLGGGLSVYPNFQLCGNDPPQRLLAV